MACFGAASDNDREGRAKELFKQNLVTNTEAKAIKLTEMKEETEETAIIHKLKKIVKTQKNRKRDTALGAAVTVAGGVAGGGAATAVVASSAASTSAAAGGAVTAATVVTISTGGIALIVIGGVLVIGAIGAGIGYGVSKHVESKEKEKLKNILNGELQQLRNKREEKERRRKQLSDEIKEIEENMKRLDDLVKQQAIQNGLTHDASDNIIVMIGKTGHGKSTLGNRMSGDTSTRGKDGPFEVSSKKDRGCTTKIKVHRREEESKQSQASEPHRFLVDTPGWGDVDEMKRDHNDNLVVAALKGCGGINAFLLVMSSSDKIDQSVQQMLKEYESLLEIDIPVIPIGKKTYQKQLLLMIDVIPKEKFNCDALRTQEEMEYDTVEEMYNEKDTTLFVLKFELGRLDTDIANKELILQKLDDAVIDNSLLTDDFDADYKQQLWIDAGDAVTEAVEVGSEELNQSKQEMDHDVTTEELEMSIINSMQYNVDETKGDLLQKRLDYQQNQRLILVAQDVNEATNVYNPSDDEL